METDRQTLAIETTGLRKSFGDTLAVDGVDLSPMGGRRPRFRTGRQRS